MSENVSENGPFKWDRLREKAALLVAEDKLTDAKIGAACDVTERTIERWKRHPDFKARVAEHVEAYRATIRARGIAILENRVDALQDRWERMKGVIAARAEEHASIPGGESGLLVRTVRGVGSGEDFELVELYAVDTGLLRELREHEKQAAQELGQWTERKDLTTGGEPIVLKVVSGVSMDDL
jgi:hypothetical protein